VAAAIIAAATFTAPFLRRKERPGQKEFLHQVAYGYGKDQIRQDVLQDHNLMVSIVS